MLKILDDVSETLFIMLESVHQFWSQVEHGTRRWVNWSEFVIFWVWTVDCLRFPYAWINKQKFKRFAITCTLCTDNAFRIWSFSADFCFDIQTPKRKICVIFAFEYWEVADDITHQGLSFLLETPKQIFNRILMYYEHKWFSDLY